MREQNGSRDHHLTCVYLPTFSRPFLPTGRVKDRTSRRSHSPMKRNSRPYLDPLGKRPIARQKGAFERSILTGTAGDALPAAALPSPRLDQHSSRHSSPCFLQPPHPQLSASSRVRGSRRLHGTSERSAARAVWEAVVLGADDTEDTDVPEEARAWGFAEHWWSGRRCCKQKVAHTCCCYQEYRVGYIQSDNALCYLRRSERVCAYMPRQSYHFPPTTPFS